ncbi:MAG TPA: LPS biosynthesis protein WbpP [Phycisphaerales bacterium]|nr:LPS biosynthesis protein WbpP [Phycisphaerales bacterium]
MARSSDSYRSPYAAAYAGRRVAITGGAGFIGSHLTSELLDLGAQVSVIDDLSAGDGQHLWYLIDTYPDRLRFHFASILEPRALKEALQDCQVVFHLAAMNSVQRSVEEPERCFAVNATGTVRVANAARDTGATRLVYAGSSSVYGDDPALPKSESMLPRPLSPYAASKYAGETVVRSWWHSYGLSGVCLRFFNVFGPRQPADGAYASVVPAFIRRLSVGQRPSIYGDGSQSRDFTPVANVVHAVLLAGAADPATVSGQSINIGCAERTTILQLASTLARLVGRQDLKPQFQEPRAAEVPHSVASIDLARRLLGYEPIKPVEDGLAETVAWMSRAAAAV